MSAPRTKRQFAGAASDPAQRQITSFFQHATDQTIASSTPTVSDSNTHSRPVLPASTQANLLNVGMRVRKSVPEGYKTGSYSAFSLFVDAKERQPAAPPATCASSYTNTQRELLPFCGINKVGGLSSQPADPLSTELTPTVDDIPSLSASQASVISNTSVPSIISDTVRSRKRSFDDDNGEDDTPSVSSCLQVPSGEWMDGQVSPRSLVPIGWENTRVMAVPKKLRRSPTDTSGYHMSADKKALAQLGQENMMLDDDFPDADFLDYRLLTDDAMEI